VGLGDLPNIRKKGRGDKSDDTILPQGGYPGRENPGGGKVKTNLPSLRSGRYFGE